MLKKGTACRTGARILMLAAFLFLFGSYTVKDLTVERSMVSVFSVLMALSLMLQCIHADFNK